MHSLWLLREESAPVPGTRPKAPRLAYSSFENRLGQLFHLVESRRRSCATAARTCTSAAVASSEFGTVFGMRIVARAGEGLVEDLERACEEALQIVRRHRSHRGAIRAHRRNERLHILCKLRRRDEVAAAGSKREGADKRA